MTQQLRLLDDGIPNGWTNDDWATPWEVVRDLETEFGPFELDPCCTPETAKAPRFYTRADNGLERPWAPSRVFCNPPFSAKAEWLKKSYHECLQGALVVCLVPARTDAAWFHEWILDKAEIRFHRRRIVFRGSAGSDQTKRPYDGTMFAIYRPSESPLPCDCEAWDDHS